MKRRLSPATRRATTAESSIPASYYRPGSLKASLCLEGRSRLLAFCDEHHIPYRIDGKIIVATREHEIPALEQIQQRGRENGVGGLAHLSAEEISRHEPHVRGLAAIWVPTAGVVDYRTVGECAGEGDHGPGRSRARGPIGHGGAPHTRGVRLDTSAGPIESSRAIVCAGLQCDRLAADLAVAQGVRIIPFRGDYYALEGNARELIRALRLPRVRTAAFRFSVCTSLGTSRATFRPGPNAVLALAREGYGRFSFAARDAASVLSWPGFWRLAGRHWRKGAVEVWRDYVKVAYWRELSRLVPALRLGDLARGPSGVRAQAVLKDGSLVDDFLILRAGPVTHVLNAPSPAATSSLAIGREVVARALTETPSGVVS